MDNQFSEVRNDITEIRGEIAEKFDNVMTGQDQTNRKQKTRRNSR